MRVVWLSIFAIMQVVSACTLVEGDRVRGSDLAKADAAYSALPADLAVGFAPLPGMKRILDAHTLAAISRAHGLTIEHPTALCFERPTHALDEARLRPVLEKALGEGTRIEIVDFSRYPVPEGEIRFLLNELPRPSLAAIDAAVIWRGRVQYGTRSSAAIWVKVRISKMERWVESAASIPARTKLDASQVVLKTGWRFPFGTAPVREIDEVVGQQTTRSLRAGQVLTPALIAPPNEIERGDEVDAELISGGVSLRFSARAETGGRRNDAVLITAEESGKRFRAYVQEKGKVLIDADTQNNPNRNGQPAGVDGADAARSRSDSQEDHPEGSGIAAGPVSR